MNQQDTHQEEAQVKLNLYGYNAIGKHVGQAVFAVILLFLGAGSLNWTWGRVFAVVYPACWIGLSIAVAIANPELLNKRGQPIKQATRDTKQWDMIILALYAVLVLVQPFVAGLDWRNTWSAPVSPVIYIIGNILMIIGFIPLTWAMMTNLYFEPGVRDQESDQQQVVTTGPYRFVRHPGYVGVILQFIALPIALGTWTAFIPGLIAVILFVIRTALEDRTLQEELPGYRAFAQETPYRLIPRLW